MMFSVQQARISTSFNFSCLLDLQSHQSKNVFIFYVSPQIKLIAYF